MNTRWMARSALAFVCCMAANAWADRPATQTERQAMGFDDPAQLVMVRDLPFPADSDTRAPDGAGLGDEWQTRIGTAFQGRTGAFNFGGQAPSIACTSGTERFATATFDLPAGAAIKYVDMFAYDNSSSEEMLVFLLSVCQGTAGADPPVSTILANSTTSGTPGDTVVTLNLSSAPVIVDRYTCRYMVRVNMASPGGTCVGGSIFLDKVRMQYTP